MKKIWIIDEALDRMGGVERVMSTLSNDLVNKYNIELISIYKSNKKPYFPFINENKIIYFYDESNLNSQKYKNNKIIYYFNRLIEKNIEFFTIKRKVKLYSKKITKDDTVIYGRVETALMFLPYIDETKKTIVREAIHLDYHKNKEKIFKYFNGKVNAFILSSDENINSYKEYLNSNIDMYKIYNPLGIVPKVIDNIDAKCIISVGRFDTQKGYDYLVRAFKIVLKSHPDWKLKLVGNGYYKPEIEKLINNLDLNDNIIITESKNNIVDMLNTASIYVMASRYEGYANALVEAMSCGLACISYDWIMGVNEIINDKKNGIIVPLSDRYRYFKTMDVIEEDINNLAKAIIYLIENPKIRENFRKEAPKIAKLRNKDDIVKKWEEIIEKD